MYIYIYIYIWRAICLYLGNANVPIGIYAYVRAYMHVYTYMCKSKQTLGRICCTANLRIMDVCSQFSTVCSTSLLLENRWNHDNGRQLFWDWQ